MRVAAGVRFAALVVAVLLTLIVALRAASPPPALPVTAPATAFSADRALIDVRALALRPHPTGSVDSMRVRDYLIARLTALGLSSDTRRYLMDDASLARLKAWSGGHPGSTDIVDVVGVLPGRDRSLPAIALMAHYDTVWGSPGGADDSAGLAAILETIRALKAQGPMQRDIVVLFTDGEELHLTGSRAFWSGDALAGHVGVVLNLESRGAGGRVAMFETGNGNGPMVALYAKSVAHPLANAIGVLAYRHMPNNTDFSPWRDAGGSGFNFAMLGRAEYYHSPRATADRLDPRSVQDLGGQVLDLTAALAKAATLPAPGPDAVFFDVGGRFMIHYAPRTGWLVAWAATALFGFAWWRARRAGLAKGIGHGVQALAWLLSNAMLGLTAFNRLSGSAHAEYYDRLAALPRLEAQAWLLCLAALAGFMAWRRATPRLWGAAPAGLLALLAILMGAPVGSLLLLGVIGAMAGLMAPERGVEPWGGWLAALGLLVVLALAAQAKEPAVAWLFAWPALLLSAGAAIVAWHDPAMERPWTPLVPALTAVLTVPPLLALGHMLFLGVGAGMPQLLLAILPSVAAAFWPLARWPAGGRGAVLLALMALAAAGALAIHVRIDPPAPTAPAYQSDK